MKVCHLTGTSSIMTDLAVLLTLNNKEILRITGCCLVRVSVDYRTGLSVLVAQSGFRLVSFHNTDLLLEVLITCDK